MATSHKDRHKGVHHLSTRNHDGTGWIESISNLTEENPATALLAENLDATLKAEEFGKKSPLEALKAEIATVGETLICIDPVAWAVGLETDRPQLDAVLQMIEREMSRCKADVTVVRRTKTPAAKGLPEAEAADILVRRRNTELGPLEVRVAIIGNVDSGKSTLVGVLTRSILDDGRGLARSKVFKHGHEESTGRTSSIGQHNLCLDSRGNILNDGMFRNNSSADYIVRSAKVVTLVDLAGHEKYFKTTAFGLTGHLPDYACLIVGANAGVVGMCKEHLGVALALKVPVFFVVTKVDLCPEHKLTDTLETLNTILRKPGVKKKPFQVRTKDDVVTCARVMHTDSLAPIFLTSSVTGAGLDLIRMFYDLIPQRHNWHEAASQFVEFIIDETFGVPGVGTVVAGTVKKGVITANTTLLLGPDLGDGSFKPTAIKSIHYKRLPVVKVMAGQTAALALKKVRRSQVRKGMILLDERRKPCASWEFDADIAILTHSTTIQPRYQAVIHAEIVRQAARVVAMDKERLRSGDRACVRFRFLQRPEYITPGTRFVFREGRTKGIGMVVTTEAVGFKMD
eukprot:jgi/Botrbrau1/5969/Bobra.104_1s0001.1